MHISDYDGSPNFDLKYATNATGSWVTNTVDSGSSPVFNSIALDSSDKVHISYYGNGGYLNYVTNATGSWVATIVDSDGNVGLWNSIALDSSGKPHISYYLQPNTLKYATLQCYDDDGDGYYFGGGCPGPLDCNDTNQNIYPTSSNSFCDCEGEIQQGIAENCSGGIDEDCDGLIDDADPDCSSSCAGSGGASTLGGSPVYGISDLSKNLAFFLLPLAAVIGLGIWRRKRQDLT